jgi:hypothetical protein
MYAHAPSLDAALRIAAQTPFYRTRLEGSVACPAEQTLTSVEPVMPRLVQSNPEWFQPFGGAPQLRRPIRLHYRRPVRMAVLEGPHIEAGARSRHFRLREQESLAAFDPEVLVAPLEVLSACVAAWEREKSAAPMVTHAIVGLTRLGGMAFDGTFRRRLWRLFEVPLFEQLEWFDGSLLAWECEGHTGLHLEQRGVHTETRESGELWLSSPGAGAFPVLRVVADFRLEAAQTACACGEVVTRLLRRGLAVANDKAAVAVA